MEPFSQNVAQTFRALVVMRKFKIFYFTDDENDRVYIAYVWDCRRNPEILIKNIRKYYDK
ncbi:hypothetical protein Barb6_02062 [Bacteroidales bacterium Barb6]|nr:hypothetical protein Barb6_02062 [Bacteroidales bacterium Barb6]